MGKVTYEGLLESTNTNKMELLEKLNWRYAAKAMNGKKVSQEKIDNIIEAISLAPTSSGL